MVAFGWRVLLDRIPARVNLALRNVLSPEASRLCVMCNRKEESALHFFYIVMWRVWCGLN